MKPDHSAAPEGPDPSAEEERQAERKEVEEMQERGTLTPESRKQGTTSHLPASETAYMYRSEENPDDKNTEEEKSKKTD